MTPARLRAAGAEALCAGQSVALSWDALPREAEEYELLLRCESPVAITVRLTESEDPDRRTFRWLVPNIPCDRARLLLRFGEGGRESLWTASSPFRIEAAPS